jgi:hypothetical protein
MPRADDLPPSLRPFVRRQAFLLSHVGFKSEIASLIAAVDKVLEAGSDYVTEQEKWQLQLVTDERFMKTFRVSSGTEAYQITVKYGAITESIAVDGKPVVRARSLNGTEYPLTELSSKLGCAVSIIVRQKVLRLSEMKTLILKIGNQILTYEANLSSPSGGPGCGPPPRRLHASCPRRPPGLGREGPGPEFGDVDAAHEAHAVKAQRVLDEIPDRGSPSRLPAPARVEADRHQPCAAAMPRLLEQVIQA